MCVCVSYHGSGCGGLRCHSRLVGLVLCSFDLGLQVRGRVEVLALLARATALDVVHAHRHRVVARVNHGAVAGVRKAAVRLAPGTVAPLKLTTHLYARTHTHTHTHKVSDGQLVPEFMACIAVGD